MTDDLRALAARLLAASPYAMPSEEAEALIKARRSKLLGDATRPAPIPAEPVTTAQPIANDLTLDPIGFAKNVFWPKRSRPPEKAKPNKKREKAPARTTHPKLTIIDGGKGVDNDDGSKD